MPRVEDLIDIEDPGLSPAGEALTNLHAKIQWAAHHLIDYEATDDINDLLEAERVLLEMPAELAHAQKAINTRIAQTTNPDVPNLFGEGRR